MLTCGFILIPACALVAAVADARAANTVHLAIGKLSHPQVSAQSLDLRIEPAIADTPASLKIRADRLRIEPLGQTLRSVEFDCTPVPVVQSDGAASTPVAAAGTTPAPPATADASPAPAALPRPASSGNNGLEAASGTVVAAALWQCEGPLRWRGGGTGWTLAWQGDEALTRADIRFIQGNSEIALRLPLGGEALAVSGKRVPAKWLAPVAPQLTWQGGRIDGRVEMSTTRGDASRWRGQMRMRALSAEAAGGAVALAGIDIGGPIDVTTRTGGELRIDTAPTLTKGELLAGPVYLAWPAESAMAIEMAMVATGGDWQVERLTIDDGGFQAEARGLLRPADTDWLQSLDADLSIDLSSRYERYVEGAMASLGQAGLDVDGTLKASLALGVGGVLDVVDSTLTGVSLRHADGRYSLAGIDGTLAFRRGEVEAAPSDLRWQSLRLHALDFGAGAFRAQSRAGEIRATQPLALKLFGGDVITRDLVYRPLSADGDRVQASVDVTGIDIAGMAAAFDWPAFAGRLDGSFPQVRYAGDVLGVGGEIAIKAFGGDVRVAGLSIERPFGVAPALSGEITLANLDLQPMTEIFGLGRIEGRLNGQIAGLRLLNWSPTAFDARLQTAESGRRRISQLAVEQLTQIGGGGAAAGIRGKLLGVFDSFGYRRIGLSCRLANDVCEMGGVDESAGGYTILQGSGLPLITIRGFQKRVDWPVLVERLKAVVAGQRPVVD